MDSISPLAKILAEANGIDWRTIQGSGAGGSIVEQDILNYLSRVMSGDEEPPATPVDEAPPGWTGEMPPMPASVAASGLQALSAAGVESDITDFVAQQSQSGQAQFVQPQPVQPQPAQPPADAPSMTVYRPAEPLAPEAFMAEAPDSTPGAPLPVVAVQPVLAADAETRPQPENPVRLGDPVQLGDSVQAAPVPPVAESEFGTDTDADSDLEFELDDELPEDDFSADGLTLGGLPPGSLSAPLQPTPVVEPVVVIHQMEQEPAEQGQGAEQEYVQAGERPAYDPVEPDSEAEFLLADSLPVAGTAPAVVTPEVAIPEVMLPDVAPAELAPPAFTPAASFQAVTPTPEVAGQSQGGRPLQEGVAEVAAGTTGFGLGGFLSRLYGSGAAAAPAAETPTAETPTAEPLAAEPAEPEVQAAPLPVSPVTPVAVPEEAIGTAHSEPYMPSFAPVSGTGGPLLGEPLIPLAPPIPDTPVAAPLVADQWRDQPEGVEDAAHAESLAVHAGQDAAPEVPGPVTVQHDPFMLGESPTEHELTSVESEQAVPETLPAVLGQPIALPEAHEGGLEHAYAEPVEAELVQPEIVQPETVPPESVAQNWTALVEPQAEHAERPADAVALPAANVQAADSQPEDSQPTESQPAVGPPVDVQPLRSQPGGSQAITLRLNVNLSVLEAARVQLSEALYREVPLSLLVARAASRSLMSLGLSTSGGVALADHAGQPLAADLSADFRASLDGLGQSAQSTPALLVLDAAELGLDELHRGECSLSVGGSAVGANALSLRGDLDPVRGAKFLHEVAGLLDTPILLLF